MALMVASVRPSEYKECACNSLPGTRTCMDMTVMVKSNGLSGTDGDMFSHHILIGGCGMYDGASLVLN